MDCLLSLFEVLVLGTTGLSLAALAGFIVWDSLVDARLQAQELRDRADVAERKDPRSNGTADAFRQGRLNLMDALRSPGLQSLFCIAPS